MDYSSDWLIDLRNEYSKFYQREPLFISDWDSLNEKAEYPNGIISKLLLNSNKYLFKYLFADEQIQSKETLLKFLSPETSGLQIENLTFVSSATASIYLTIISLYKKGIRRFLVFTPVYYSILDTLNDLNATVIYFPLLDDEDFKIDVTSLNKSITENNIEAIFFVDPIYSAGIEMPSESYLELVEACNEKNLWLICDYTLGGLEWNLEIFEPFPQTKIKHLTQCKNYVFIDSISKRFLINGLKISVVLSSIDLIKIIENFSSQILGGLNATQIGFINEFYSSDNSNQISAMLKNNILIMKNNYELLSSILLDSQYSLYNCNSSYFTMIAHNEIKSFEVNPKEIIKNFLFQENLLAFPSFHFSFDDRNRFAFRINVINDPSIFVNSLNRCIGINIECFHKS